MGHLKDRQELEFGGDAARASNGFGDILAEHDASGNMVARYVYGPGIDEPNARPTAESANGRPTRGSS